MNKETLDDIEKFAALAFAPEQVAIICEIDEKEFLEALYDPKSDISKAYHKGVYKIEAQLRSVVFEQALSGSTPAQTIALGYMNELKLKLMR